MRFVRTALIAAAFAGTLFVSSASATRTPEQVVLLSGSFVVQIEQIADASSDQDVIDAIDNAVTVFETEQPKFKKSLQKNAKEVKNLDKLLTGNETYEEQVEFLIVLYQTVMGTCGLEANAAILNGKGSIISKSKRIAAFSKQLTKAGDYAADTTKPRFKRIKKMATFVGKAEAIVNKANK